MAIELSFPPTARRTTLAPIGGVVVGVLAEMDAVAQELDVRLDVEEPLYDFSVPAFGVRTVLRNLLGNALESANPDVPLRWVRVSVQPVRVGGGCVVVVSDNGLGIAPESQDRIFERDVRGVEQADAGGPGLAHALDTAHQMDGEITFDSDPGFGSTFRLHLPRFD